MAWRSSINKRLADLEARGDDRQLQANVLSQLIEQLDVARDAHAAAIRDLEARARRSEEAFLALLEALTAQDEDAVYELIKRMRNT